MRVVLAPSTLLGAVLFSLAVSCTGTKSRRGCVGSSRELLVPDHAPEGKQIIDANFQSYSVEYCYMQDFAGNNSFPNTFSARMVQNLKDISGEYPIFRVGGSTQNRAIYNPNQTLAIFNKFSTPTADQPSSVTIGPAWVEAFQQLPKGTKYIYGLSFYNLNDSLIGYRNGLDETVVEAELAYNGFKDDLLSFEIGNEVDGWACGSRRPCNWTVASYVPQWSQYGAAILDKLGVEGPLFQGCAFEAPRHVGYNATPFWNVENAVAYGMNSSFAKTLSDHDYMGAYCGTGPGPTIEANLLNHYRMTSLMWYHDYLGNATADSGIEYVLGETNSISCQGAPNISDVYAAALWAVDYTAYVASLKVSRLHFHMGTPYRYSPWQPINWYNLTVGPKPLYYGNMFTAKAFAGGNKQVSVLVNETTFTAYAIYNAAKESSLESVIVVNMAMWNSTQDPQQRPYTAVKLPAQFASAHVRRLTSPGVEIPNNITFAGQYVSNEGFILGKEVVEPVANGKVLVGAGEAVLVSL